MKVTAGGPAASCARRLPMGPAPTTAIPSCVVWSIAPLLRLDAGFAREPALLVELRPDVLGELLGRRARPELDAALDETLVQIRGAHGPGDRAVDADQRRARRSRGRDQAVERDVLVARHRGFVHGRHFGKERRARAA